MPSAGFVLVSPSLFEAEICVEKFSVGCASGRLCFSVPSVIESPVK